ICSRPLLAGRIHLHCGSTCTHCSNGNEIWSSNCASISRRFFPGDCRHGHVPTNNRALPPIVRSNDPVASRPDWHVPFPRPHIHSTTLELCPASPGGTSFALAAGKNASLDSEGVCRYAGPRHLKGDGNGGNRRTWRGA